MSRQTYYRPPTQFSVFPPVIKNLLIINGLIFIAQFVAQATQTELLARFLNLMALYPVGAPDVGYTIYGTYSEIPGFWPWQLVTYAFLHGSFGHILFNMFALWMFGVQIENRWGSQRFAVFYFICVIGAAITHLFFISQAVPTVGASGGVFGVLLAFGMMFPNQPIYLYFLFPIKAKWLVIGLGVIELWSGISGTQAGVANFAHLGGMVFGFLLIQYWRGKLPAKPQQTMRW
jgi:membrane associated rhomboid family serine protease